MKQINQWLMAALVIVFASCSTARQTVGSFKDDGKIEVVFVQVNDVYEIAPLAGGKEGGMARVATLKKTYEKQNPNTFLVMAGDFLSPSVYNSLKYEGKRIRGKQMVDAMNAAGMNYAMFGNHEFDIAEDELQDRINESGFKWISSNAFHKVKDSIQPFARTNMPGSRFPETYIMQVRDADGTAAKIGFFAITLPFNKAPYVSYTDPLATAKIMYERIKDSVDAVVAITHQAMKDDIRLATEVPGLALILGGHEHDMRFEKVGNIYITKAHANAKSAYVIKLLIDKKNGKRAVTPKLQYLDASIAIDTIADKTVQKWVQIANENYASLGFDAHEVVIKNGEPLDGRETEVRAHVTNLTKLIIKSIEYVTPTSDIVIMNAGSVRVDDVLPMPLTQYDIIRSLPFGGGIKVVDMKGGLLIKVLNAGQANKGTGGYLISSEKVKQVDGNWFIANAPVDTLKTYTVSLTEFLFTGGESNLDFLKPGNPEISLVYDASETADSAIADIRLALIKYLKSLNP